jgi:isocitrate dehydrogenase
MPGKIIYTQTDEAPALATQSLLPIIRKFAAHADIEFEIKDISLASRILAHFPEFLKAEQRHSDALAELGKITQDPKANIIKLPNISASVPQLKKAIAELQSQGYSVPDYPEDPQTAEEEKINKTYSKVLGSAVNPVLREGNSNRLVAKAVKTFARNNPHSMGAWSPDSKTHVASMKDGDFYGSEQSVVLSQNDCIKIELITEDGQTQSLKAGLSLLKGEVIDASVMSQKALRAFLDEQVKEAKAQGVLFSVHLKATMMKVSDPILFGQAVESYFSPVFAKFEKEFEEVGVDSRFGLGDLIQKISSLPAEKQDEINQALKECMESGPDLAMVNSEKGITNLHVPSDVIIDASMPAAIRTSGKMWNKKGELQDMKAVIPDRCYADLYQKTIDFCKAHGAFDPTTMGSVANVGLMAQKAEEYGSHDKTFWIEKSGTVKVINQAGETLMEHRVEKGDIWRMCQTKDVAIQDWVKLAVTRARATGSAAYFWLNSDRAHDKNLIQKVKTYLKDHDTQDLDIQILSVAEATQKTLERVKAGEDVISVTGNVLRDYLTDLFPILELGTSAKMLSIVPLLAGGGLFETGAGGSAPKHVQQFQEENHLRWDSLGEFLALSVSLEDYAIKNNNEVAKVLVETLNQANETFLKENKSPSRNVKELDSRGSHFYLALYWAEALAAQTDRPQLQDHFQSIYAELKENEHKIVEELNSVQGASVDMGGYYLPDPQKVAQAMRPSETFNRIVEKI